MTEIRKFNVVEAYKNLNPEQVNTELDKRRFPYAVMMEQWTGNFNIGTFIRNANAFMAKEVFYIGRKKYDRRGTVGTHHYVNLRHFPDISHIHALKEKYHFICFENNVENVVPLSSYKWPSGKNASFNLRRRRQRLNRRNA